jgi:hypothetical protein
VLYRLGADLVVVLHLAFVAYVALGGVLVRRWPWTVWLHLPAAIWGIGIEWIGGICPLTPLENWLRERGGEAGYPGGFIEHYLLPVLYPSGLTRRLQVTLGLLVLVGNVAIYWSVVRRRRGPPSQRTGGR